MKGIPYGEMSFYESLGRKEVVGALLIQGMLMVLGFGMRLERNGILSLLVLLSLWGMEGDFAFGRMLGVGKRPFPAHTPPFFPWQLIKRSL